MPASRETEQKQDTKMSFIFEDSSVVLVSCLHYNGCRDYISSLAPWLAVIVRVVNLFWSAADYAFMSQN